MNDILEIIISLLLSALFVQDLFLAKRAFKRYLRSTKKQPCKMPQGK